MGCSNPGMFSKHEHFGQDQTSRIFWCRSIVSMDVLDRIKHLLINLSHNRQRQNQHYGNGNGKIFPQYFLGKNMR